MKVFLAALITFFVVIAIGFIAFHISSIDYPFLTFLISDFINRHRLLIAAGILFFLLVLLVWVPKRQVNTSGITNANGRFNAENEARKTIAQIIGGAAFFITLFITWQTLIVDREGQITERFTRAIDQLGSEKLQIRLGGIYALEPIARDSEKDHWQIMEVLTTEVRENVPWPPQTKEVTKENKSKEDQQLQEEDKSIKPKADIQAILTVIGWRDRDNETENQSIDLGETDLRGADLKEANLQEASLEGANLERASLWNVNLQGASLLNANLQEARDLTVEQLSKVKTLYGAKLDPPLMEQIQKDYPHLLEELKPEETEGG